MRIAFSRDRAAQLDLLLRSAEWAGCPIDTVIACATDDFYRQGYEEIGVDEISDADKEDFDGILRDCLWEAVNDQVTFFCDDDVFIRRLPFEPEPYLREFDTALCVSLRLGVENLQQLLPEGFPCWRWREMPRTDFGFPGSVDGHCFRVEDVLFLIGLSPVASPTMLETALVSAIEVKEFHEHMLSFRHQMLVGVPVNRVSPHSGVQHGVKFPQPPEELNESLLQGMRIDHEAMLPELQEKVDGCHYEILYPWVRA